jgi:hypothetical protein
MSLILGLINLVTDKYNFQKVEKQIDSPYNFLQKEKRWYLGFGVSTFEQSNMQKFSLLEPLEKYVFGKIETSTLHNIKLGLGHKSVLPDVLFIYIR